MWRHCELYIIFLIVGDSTEAQQEFAKNLAQTISSLDENSEELQVVLKNKSVHNVHIKIKFMSL